MILLNISNLMAIPLLIHKGLFLYAGLTLFLFVMAFSGYFNWRRILSDEKNMQLTDAAIAVLKDQQQKAIQQKSLSDEQLELIYLNKWFKIWVPESLNGLGLDLVSGLSC
ncbi:nicotinamide mononucleotide transporter [Sphingobacterium sp. E70]|uniref:nicotinamide mononucleotide transporter n=1 Tax=Sphingobacterium sp. E70 TaxID=2853439 RepID=UPI002795A181|nr:nicotinamide mononucleotide transporter [Sphingobacterium sp. E70]